MDSQGHIVSGIYASRAEAEAVRRRLIERGLPRQQAKVVERARADDDLTLATDDEVLKNVLVDGAVGAAAGTGIFALAQVALVAANVTLFVASPLTAPLAMLGWGAALGGIVGATVGADHAKKKNGMFSELVLDAIRSGHVTLIAQTRTAAEKKLACEVIGDSVAQRSERRSA